MRVARWFVYLYVAQAVAGAVVGFATPFVMMLY